MTKNDKNNREHSYGRDEVRKLPRRVAPRLGSQAKNFGTKPRRKPSH